MNRKNITSRGEIKQGKIERLMWRFKILLYKQLNQEVDWSPFHGLKKFFLYHIKTPESSMNHSFFQLTCKTFCRSMPYFFIRFQTVTLLTSSSFAAFV